MSKFVKKVLISEAHTCEHQFEQMFPDFDVEWLGSMEGDKKEALMRVMMEMMGGEEMEEAEDKKKPKGNVPALKSYWREQMSPARPGTFTRCSSKLQEHGVPKDWAAGFCAKVHKEATGMTPMQKDTILKKKGMMK